MTRIPKILHYVFGMARDFGGKPWSLVHHVGLKSAVARIRPERVFLFYEFEPTGPWWALSRKLVTPVKINAPKEIFGRPLQSVAHRADVVRLQKLIQHGGIYLDADVIVQRSFDDLLDHAAVLGQEGVDAEYGLANAVMLAEPQSVFMRRWLQDYRTFRGTGLLDASYNEHSVQLPATLARAYPKEITVLNHTAFFWPLWIRDHIKWIFGSNKRIPSGDAYANHLWESYSWEFLEDLTPGRVRSVNTNFHNWARPFIRGLPNNYGAPSVGSHLKRAKRPNTRKVNLGMRDRCHWLERGAERVDVIGPDTVRSDVATAAVQPKVADLLTAGLAHHQAGRLHEAELEYRAVLALSPVQAEALYLLGVVAYQCARPELALELIGNAIQQNGSFPAYHTSYGLALQQLGRLHGALESHDRALALVPGNAEALNNRGLVLQELERFDEALESYDRALAIKPDLAMTLINRGNALRALHRLDEAVASYDRALALEPNSVEATYNRNNALKDSQLA